MNRVGLTSLILLLVALLSPLGAREWTDASGSFRVEAELVSVRNGKVYLEKSDDTITAVPLEKLSAADLAHLLSLEEHAEYFRANPIPGMEALTAKPAMVEIEVDDESIVGEVRRFPDMGWGVKSLAFSPDGRFLAVGKMDKTLMVFDVNESARVAYFDELEALDQITCVAFTPNGAALLAGGSRGQIKVWNVSPKGLLTEANGFYGHVGEVKTITIAADGKTVLSGGRGKKARCWSLETGRETFSVDGFKGDVRATYVTADGKQGLACDGDVLALIDMEQGTVTRTMKLASRSAQAVAIAPDGSRVSVGDTYALRMWDIRSGREFPPLQDNEIQWTAAFMHNSKYVLSGGRGLTNVWEVETSSKIRAFNMRGTYYVQTLACSPDNRHFAAIPGSAGQDLLVFRLPAEYAEE